MASQQSLPEEEKEEIPPFKGGYFSDLPDELVTYILDKSLIKIIKDE